MRFDGDSLLPEFGKASEAAWRRVLAFVERHA
jgi:hypothetical protein